MKKVNINFTIATIEDDIIIMTINRLYELITDSLHANKIYIVSKKIKRDKKEIKDKKDKELQSLEDYLEKNIKPGDGELLDEIETKLLIHHTVRHSLFWYRQNDKKFNVNSLKNIAINFLYKRQNIDENNILIYLKL